MIRVAGTVTAAGLLAGCAAGVTPRPVSRPAHTATPAAAPTYGTSGPAAHSGSSAPKVGTTLLQLSGPALDANAVSDGDGFTVVTHGESNYSLTSYNKDGKRLAQVSKGFSGSCGVTEVNVPTVGQVLVVGKVTTTYAQGLQAGSQSVAVLGYSATTGTRLWSADVVPVDISNSQGCVSVTPTADGLYGVFTSSYVVTAGNPQYENDVINLATGEFRSDPDFGGVLGNYIFNGDPNSGGQLTDPATGQVLTNLQLDPGVGGGDEYTQLSLSPNGVMLAPRGVFYSPSADTSPSAGLTWDGTGLLALRWSASSNSYTVARYSLPTLAISWSLPQNQQGYWLLGDAGGVALIAPLTSNADFSQLDGVDDTTGHTLWSIPYPNAICAVTSSQMMISINGQLAVIDLANGHQVSYNQDNYCPNILPGGIEDRHGTLTQALTP